MTDTAKIEAGRALLAHTDNKHYAHKSRADFREWLERNADWLLTAAAERDALAEQLHYANGTCDLAIKHRNNAEAQVWEIEAETIERCAKIIVFVAAKVFDDERTLLPDFEVISLLEKAEYAIRALSTKPQETIE